MRICQSLPLIAAFLLCSCNQGSGLEYKIDALTFSGKVPITDGSAPSLFIDTNIKVSSLFGGTIRTSKPYSLSVDYTDETLTLKKMVLTRVSVVAPDGTVDPGIASLKLPIQFAARNHEVTNSMNGGAIVKTKLRLAAGSLEGAVTRDVPVTVQIEGHIVMDDGTKKPFSVKQSFEAKKETGTKPWSEVMSDC